MSVFLAVNAVVAALCLIELVRAVRTQEVSVPLAAERLARSRRPGAFWMTIGFWSALFFASLLLLGQNL